MTVLDVYRYQPDLVRISNYLTSDSEAAADAVQNLYVKLCEMECKEGNLDRIFYKGKLNMVYVFAALRTILADEYRATKHLEPLQGHEDPLTEMEEDISTDEMCACVRLELAQMREYDRLLTLTFYGENHSIRSMAKEVGISASNIYYTLEKVQSRIKSVILSNEDKFPKIWQSREGKKRPYPKSRNLKVSEIQ